MVYTYVYMCVMYSAKLQYIQLSAFSQCVTFTRVSQLLMHCNTWSRYLNIVIKQQLVSRLKINTINKLVHKNKMPCVHLA